MGSFNAFVTDGYDEKAFIREMPGVYDHPVEITFRPATYTEQTVIFDRVNALRQDKRFAEADAVMVEEIAARVSEWRFFDHWNDYRELDGVPQPDADSVRRLKPALFARLSLIVIHGTDGGDRDPRRKSPVDQEIKTPRERTEEKQGNC